MKRIVYMPLLMLGLALLFFGEPLYTIAQNFIVPTAPVGTNNNEAASTAFVQNAITSGGGPTENANTFFAGPTSGSPASATWRTIVGADLPTPTSSTLGGIYSFATVTHQFLSAITTAGTPTSLQPACGDLSNGAASCSTDTTNATNISSGTLGAGRLPAFGSGDVSFASGGGAGTIAANAVTNAKLAQAASHTIKGNISSSTANVADLTPGQVGSILCTLQVTTLATGTNATFNVPTCNGITATYLEIEMVGAGGGGGGSGSSAGTAATGGASTCWNTSSPACSTPLFSAGGGGAGSQAGTATASTGGSATGCDFGLTGAGASGSNLATAVNLKGVDGADSFFGGRGIGTYNTSVPSTAAVANTGSGGGGGGGNTATALEPGGGGGAGAYCRKIITTPATSYVYTIGTHGSHGAAGTSGGVGGDGADGVIYVKARWQ